MKWRIKFDETIHLEDLSFIEDIADDIDMIYKNKKDLVIYSQVFEKFVDKGVLSEPSKYYYVYAHKLDDTMHFERISEERYKSYFKEDE